MPSITASEPSLLPGKVRGYGIALACIWTAVVGASLAFDLWQANAHALDAARIQARSAFDRDILYQRWAMAREAGKTPSQNASPELARQVHALGQRQDGVQAHITSLNPIGPGNGAAPWERAALAALKTGAPEISELVTTEGRQYLHLMRPLVTEASCLQCHNGQGYQSGDIQGGINISVPMTPYAAIVRAQWAGLAAGHAALWLLGLAGLLFGTRSMHRRILERERLVKDLEQALAKVKILSGLLPICAWCKKVRTDTGYWMEIEAYIQQHSDAEFTHGMCGDCLEKFVADTHREKTAASGKGIS
jgi:hypothetical protein